MQGATELQEYNANGEFKKAIITGPVEDVEDDEDPFSIGDDEPKMEANDYKPLEQDLSPTISIADTPLGAETISTPLDVIPEPEPTESTEQAPTLDVPTISISSGSPASSSPSKSKPSSSAPTSKSSSPVSSPTPSRLYAVKPASTTSLSTLTAPTTSASPSSASPSSAPSSPHPSKQVKTASLLNSSNGGFSPEAERKFMTYDERLKIYEDVLQSDLLEIHLLRELAWQGIPEAKGLRAKYWKIMLHYLPTNKELWDASLVKSRKLYQDWVKELVIDPHAASQQADHPLSLEKDSKWNAFFKDNEILAEIDKDVKRTFPHLHFFNQISPTGEEVASPHYHVLKQILFIYAKLNPGIRYVQGMNELLGPIYYTFATDSDTAFRDNAEADAFFCFTHLMSEVMDNFCKSLDKSEMGIVGNMRRLNLLFKEQDHELWLDLEDKKMNPQFYSFRWLTLLLSQEFELPEVLRLWDSLFADPERFNFFYCFCCAMLICVREKLLDGSFADNLKLLQSYPPIDFQVIFAVAQKVHDNTYEPPPARKKPDPTPPQNHSLSSHSHTHTHSHTLSSISYNSTSNKTPSNNANHNNNNSNGNSNNSNPSPNANKKTETSTFSLPTFFASKSPPVSTKSNNDNNTKDTKDTKDIKDTNTTTTNGNNNNKPQEKTLFNINWGKFQIK